MKKKIFLHKSQLLLLLLCVSLTVVFFSACNVVIPSFAPANEFGYALSGDCDPQEPYAVGLLQCKTELYPNILFPTENASASLGYINTLNTAFPSWTFNNSATSLSEDAIEIKTYDAIGTSTRVGVWIHARYVPHDTDPTDNIHWIQILTTNHGLGGTGHGPIVTYIDAASGTTTPYYDEGYAADSRDLIDRPSRTDASLNHTWEATTFLATGPDVGDAPGTVTLLGPGFTWGWKNTCEATDGLQEFYYYREKPEVVEVPDRLEPGGKFRLVNESPANLVLGKEKSKATVPVLFKEITFTIDEKVDVWGMVSLINGEGMIKFGTFNFEGKKMPPVTAEISRGYGYMNIETGEASIEYVIPLQLPDGTTKNMVFTETGQFDKETNSFTLNTNMIGISESFLKLNVPKDTKQNKEK